MMNWLGHGIARKILSGTSDRVSAFDTGTMPTHPLFHGKPWFLPVVGTYYQARDWLDRSPRCMKGRVMGNISTTSRPSAVAL